MMRGRSEEIVGRYRELIGRLRDSRRRSVDCGLIRRHDANSLILGRMLGINARVKDLCRGDGVMFVDVWDQFSQHRSLFARDGLHLSYIGEARLGLELTRSKDVGTDTGAQIPSEVRPSKSVRSVGTEVEQEGAGVSPVRSLGRSGAGDLN